MQMGTNASPAAPFVLSVLQNPNSHGGGRANAATVLGIFRISGPEIHAALLDGVKPGPDKLLQANCAVALWRLDSQYAPLATRLGIEFIADNKRRFHQSALDLNFTLWSQGLGLDASESVSTLKQLLESDSDEVREAAAEALEKIEAQTKSGAKQ